MRALRDKNYVYFYHKISHGFHKKTMKQSYLEEPGLQTVDVVDPIHQLDNLLRGDLKYSRWQLTDCLAVWQQLPWFNDTLNSSIIFCGQFIVFTYYCAESNFCVLSLASDNNFHQTKLLFRIDNVSPQIILFSTYSIKLNSNLKLDHAFDVLHGLQRLLIEIQILDIVVDCTIVLNTDFISKPLASERKYCS